MAARVPEAAGTGAARGKVILLGEHAVVHGVPALAGSLDRGAMARATRTREASSLTIGRTTVAATDGSDLARALAALLAEIDVSGPVTVDLESELPAGCGLGASAALGAATARAVLALEGREGDDPYPPAMAWERVFHGNPSGVDTAAALGAGVLRFQRHDDGAVALEPVDLGAPVPLVIAIAGPPASTKAMVAHVAALEAARPRDVGARFEAITALVEQAEGALATGDLATLGRCLDANHEHLAALELSTPAIEEACAAARDAGALGAKLTGAGGGGAVVVLAGSAGQDPILGALEYHGIPAFASTLSPATPSSPEP